MTRKGIQRRGTRTGGHSPRGRSEDRWRRLLHWIKERWRRLLAYDPFWVLLFLGTVTWVLSPSQGQWDAASLDPGSIAPRDFVAPRDALLPDEQTTEQRRSRAQEEVLPVYDLDPAAASRIEEEISRLFRRGRELFASESAEEEEKAAAEEGEDPDEGREEEPTPEELTSILQDGSRLTLEPDQVKIFRDEGFTVNLEDRLEGVVDQILEQGVVAGKTVLLENRTRGIQLRNLERGTERRQLDLYGYLDYPEDVRDAVATELRGWGDFTGEARAGLQGFLVSNISPNLHLNQRETLRRQDRAAAEVEPVYTGVREGQVIVRQGDRIDAGTARVLAALAPDGDLRSRILPILGTFLFAALIVLVLWLGIRRTGIAEARRETILGEALLLLMASILGARLCVLLADGLASSLLSAPFRTAANYYYAVPFAALALVSVLLYGRGLALLLALSLSVLAPVIVGEAGAGMIIFCLAGSMAAILTVDHYQFKQRSLLVRAGAVVGMVNAVAILMLYTLSRGPGEAGTEGGLWLPLVCALAGGVLVAGVTSFAVQVLESLYSVTTGIKLVELANTNLPVLRRLAFEAPGTFQHSLMVANLAKAGCEAIGADSVLAYTGALYHDIGKIFRPEYFVENQRSGQNRHDKVLPSMSALILISHVKDGLELAREHHLPEPILQAITEHHGTRLITYFYERAKAMQDPESGEVSEEKFRYPGPKPGSKVMGVLMLADGVEAASRTLADPSPSKIRTVIRKITEDCLQDGQLDETDLTLGDLNRIAEAFQRIISHVHHRRLDYPGFDFNQAIVPGASGKPVSARRATPSPSEKELSEEEETEAVV